VSVSLAEEVFTEHGGAMVRGVRRPTFGLSPRYGILTGPFGVPCPSTQLPLQSFAQVHSILHAKVGAILEDKLFSHMVPSPQLPEVYIGNVEE